MAINPVWIKMNWMLNVKQKWYHFKYIAQYGGRHEDLISQNRSCHLRTGMSHEDLSHVTFLDQAYFLICYTYHMRCNLNGPFPSQTLKITQTFYLTARRHPLPLPSVIRHSGLLPSTVTPSIDQALHQLMTLLLIWTLLPNLTFYLIARGINRTFATGAACQQRMLTPPDTCSCPTLGLASVLMLRPISPELVLFPDFFSFEHPLVLLFLLCSGLWRVAHVGPHRRFLSCDETCSSLSDDSRVYYQVRMCKLADVTSLLTYQLLSCSNMSWKLNMEQRVFILCT